MAASPLQTSLTLEYPSTSSLTRSDLLSLIGSWDPSRPSAPWYHQSHPPGASNMASASSSSAPPLPPPEEQAFESFVESLPAIKSMRAESERLLRDSEEKAARNAALQPSLEALRLETQQLYDRARSLETQWPIVEGEMREACKRFSQSSLLFTLTHSATKLHDQSESMANAYVEGLPLNLISSSHQPTPPESGKGTPTGGREADSEAAFIRRYRALRTTYHRRNLMANQWAKGTVSWHDD